MSVLNSHLFPNFSSNVQVYQHKYADLKKAHDRMLQEIAEKAANIQSTEVNLTKLQNSYDLLLADFK